MSQTALVSALVALGPGLDPEEVRALLARSPGVEVTRLVDGFDESWSALSTTASDAVVVACEPGSEQALWFIRETSREHPERPVVVLCIGTPNGLVRHAFEAGAEDLVMLAGPDADPAPVAEQLAFALEKAVARRSGSTSERGSALASLICVLGPKGGIGKTLTSTNLSVALAQLGRRVVAVDLDLQFGDVGLSMGLTPQRTIHDLVKSGGSLDGEKIEAYLTRHESGARVLMAPVRPDQASGIHIDFLRDIYPLLRATNDFVIVDTPPGFTPEVITSIDASTHVCLVGMLDSLSLKNTKLGLETLELMGYDRDRIRMVLNRADTKVGVTQEDVATIVGRPADVLVPSHRDVVRSVNEGSPVVLSRPRSDAAKAFRALAASYAGQPEAENRKGRKLRRKG